MNAGILGAKWIPSWVFKDYDRSCDDTRQAFCDTKVFRFAVVSETTWLADLFKAIAAFLDSPNDSTVIHWVNFVFISWILWPHINGCLLFFHKSIRLIYFDSLSDLLTIILLPTEDVYMNRGREFLWFLGHLNRKGKG